MSRNAQQRTWADWFKSNKSKRTQRRPALEMLEDRAVPAVTVTTLLDGPDAAQPIAGSLRAAIIEAARTDGKIDFAPALFTSGSLPKTLVLNGAVGSIILNSGKDITITGPGADKLIIQSDIGFTKATATKSDSNFKQGNQLRQKPDTTGINGYQGGAIFTVTSIDDSTDGILGNFIGSIKEVAVTNPGSNGNRINQQVTLSQSLSGQFQLEPINGTVGTGAEIKIESTSYGLNPGVIEQSMQISGANTLTISGIHFGDTNGNVIKQNLGNLVVDNCIFDNANTFGTDRQVTNFIFADVGAGTLSVTDSTFTNASLRAIDISNGAGNLTITGTAVGKSIFTGNDVAAISASASKIAISQTSITGNGDGPNGTGPISLINASSVTLTDVAITNNIVNAASTATQGGAFIQGNNVTLTNPTITGNVPNSKSTQGAIRIQSFGSVSVSGAVVDSNNPSGMASYRAMEILGNPSKTTISESVFSNNTAGGALAIVSQSTNISKSYFNNNESSKTNNIYGTTNTGTTGGSALITTGSGLTSITQSVFTNNKLSSVTTANSGGAAIFSGNGGLAIDKSVFENNSVAITGYPTPSPLPDPTIYSSNPEKQPAPRYSGGGAIRSGAGTTITNSEIAFNSVTSVVDFWLPPNAISPANPAIPAYSGGGGVYISNDTGGNTTNQIINTTFFGNSVVQTGQTNSGNANIQSTGKGLNGGAVIIADGHSQGGANYSASDPFRGGNSTTRFVNTTITNNSLVNPFADKNNSNYLSGAGGFNNSDTGGVFNDSNSGSRISTLNTINVQNTGIIYISDVSASNFGDPIFGIANTGNRFSNNGVGTFGSSGYSMFNPVTSPGFTFNGTKGNLIGSDQNAGIDPLGLQNNLGTVVGVTPVTGVAATTNANAIVRSVSIDRLSPARDTGLDVTQAGNNPTNPVIAITTDVRNVPRAINVAVDMGAVELQTATKSSVVTSTPLSIEYGQVQTVTTRVDFDDSKASVTPITGVMRIVSIIPDSNGNNVVTEYGRATIAPVTGSILPASETTITLNGDATVAGLPLLPPGTNILYAQYLGDNSYVDSQSAPFTVTIAPATTTTTLNASVPNPADVATATKITISGSIAVTHPSATPVSTGLFPIGTVRIGQKQLGSGGAYTTLGTTPVDPDGTFSYDVVGVPLVANILPNGVYEIQALFTATDSTKFASDADTLKQEVGIVPIVSVSLSNNTIERGELITFTVDVAPDDSDLVQPGSVTLIRNGVDFITILRGDSTVGSNGSGHLYSVTINTADPQYNFLVSPTPYVISARYNRNDSGIYNTTSSLASQNLTITNQRTDTILTVTPNSSITYGDQIDLSASTDPHTVGSIIPFAAGSITFSDTLDGTLNGPNTTKAGVNPSSSFSTTNLTVGSHTLTATYNGDATNYAASSSNGVNIVVNKANTSLAFTSSPTPAIVNLGSSINFTVIVSTPAINAPLKPTGNVVFSSPTNPNIQTVAIIQANGTATYTYTPSATGIETITASYSGDGNYLISSNTLVVTVPTITLAPIAATPIQRGNSITLSAAIDPADTNINQPGSVDFLYGSTIVTSVPRSASTHVSGKQVYEAIINTGDNAYSLFVNANPYNIAARYNRDGGNYPSQTSSTQPLTIINQDTTTTLTITPNSPAITYGDRLDLAAATTPGIPGSIIPFAAGSITFSDTLDGTLNGPNTTKAGVNPSSSFSTTNLTVGSHTLTATYSGDGTNYAASTTTNGVNIVVNKANTSLTFTSSPTPAIVNLGSSINFTVIVSTPAINAPLKPTGNVVFSSPTNPNIQTVAIIQANGTATYTYTPYATGIETITASYSGDGNYLISNNTLVVTVPTITLAPIAATPIQRGNSITLSAAIDPADTNINQPGSVDFLYGSTIVTSVPRSASTLVNGKQVYTTSINTGDNAYSLFVNANPYNIAARYNRDGGNYPSQTSSTQPLTIINQDTTTTLTITPNSPAITYGDRLDLAAATSPGIPGSIIPFTAGSITFSDTLDGTISGPNTTKAGVNPSSSFSTTNLTVGSHTLTATYNGDATNYAASTSNGVNIVVNKANTSLAFTSSPTPAIVNLGSSINFTVIVSTPAINAPLKPTGNVVFSSPTNPNIQTVAIIQANGTATYTYTPSATGIENITASYSGDGNYQVSSNTLVVTVPTITLAPIAATPVQRGNSITLSAAIDPADTNINQPGSVDFLYGSTIVTSVPRSASTLVSGKQVYTTTINTGDNAFSLFVNANPYNIAARYNRDGGNYPSQTSSTQPLNIVQQSSSIILTGLPNTSSTTSTITYGDRIDLTTNLNSFINNSIIPFASNATGIVIRDGSTIIARLPIANDARAAVLTKTDFTVGTHVLTAEFVGDTNYALSTSPAFTLIVNQAVTRLNLTSNSDYLALGQTFTVSAAVESTAATMPTAISGNVVFVATDSKGGTTNLATGTIFNGKASSTFTPTVAGHYVISAQYIGDTNYAGTLSTRTVTASSISIQIQDPSTLFGTSIFQRGSDINIVATLTPGDTAAVDQITGLPVQPGAVSFILPNGTVVATVSRASSYDLNGSRIYSATVNSGNLLYSLPVGTTTVRSRYNVDGGLYPMVSSAASPLTIIKQDTTTTLTGSISGTLPYGSPVSFDATVSPTIDAFGVTENEIAFGKSQIQFFDGSNLILASAVDNTTRSAPLSLSALSVGQHIITARYATDGLNYAASKSSPINITIAKAATTTDVSLSRPSIDAGDTVILTAQVGSNVNGAALNPSGTVTFYLKNGAERTEIGSAPLNSTTGLSTFSYKPTSVKSYQITATYSGDSNYATSNSTADPDTLRVKTFQPFYAVALQGGSVLATYNTRTNALIARYQPMGPNYRGGFTVARGDVNADGVSDLLYAPNKGSFVRIIDGRSSHDLGGFFAFGSNFGQAISIAVGDISGDGKGDIMVAPAGRGAAGIVRVFSGANFSNLLYQGTPYGAGFAGGISLASADVNGDGRADIITAPLSGGASRIVVVSGATRSVIRDYLAFGSSYIGGANVTAADINGDGKAEIIVGAMVGRGNIVVQDGATNTQRASFFAYQAGYNGGARVAAISDVNADGFLDLVVTPGAGGGTKASRYSGANYRLIDSFFAFSANEPGSNGGMRPA